MKLWLPLLACALAFGAWHLHRYGVFTPPTPELPARAPDRIAPQKVVTLFGASNFSRRTLQHGLTSALAGCGATVRVVAKAGASSDWALGQTGAAYAEGGIVIVGFIGNDGSLWRGMPVARSLANHRILLDRAAKAGVTVLLPVGEGARMHGLRGAVRPAVPVYGRAINALAAAYGAGLFQTGARWRALDDATLRRLMPDGLHTTPEAVLELSLPDYVAALRPLLCR